MIRIEANTVDIEMMGENLPHAEARLEFEVEDGAQFENEAEAILWNVIMFMADHSELNEQEILLSLLSDLEDNDETPPFERMVAADE